MGGDIVYEGDGEETYDYDTGYVQNSNGDDLNGCAAVGAGTAPTDDDMEPVTVTIDVIHQIQDDAAFEGSTGILELMKADLQDHVAPKLADCYTGNGKISPSMSDQYTESDATYVAGSQTYITNVEFDDLTGEDTSTFWLSDVGMAPCLGILTSVSFHVQNVNRTTNPT